MTTELLDIQKDNVALVEFLWLLLVGVSLVKKAKKMWAKVLFCEHNGKTTSIIVKTEA